MNNFAEIAFAFGYAKEAFRGSLEDAGLEDKFGKVGWDDYDRSLELYDVE